MKRICDNEECKAEFERSYRSRAKFCPKCVLKIRYKNLNNNYAKDEENAP